MGRALVLTGDIKTAEWVNYEPKKENSYLVIQKAVGGSFEALLLGKGWECYVNESGLINGLAQNESAAYLICHLLEKDKPILVYGPAFFCFVGKGKADATKSASEWFDVYKSGKFHRGNDVEDEDEEMEIKEDEEEEEK